MTIAEIETKILTIRAEKVLDYQIHFKLGQNERVYLWCAAFTSDEIKDLCKLCQNNPDMGYDILVDEVHEAMKLYERIAKKDEAVNYAKSLTVHTD